MSAELCFHGVYTAYDKADVLENINLTVKPGTITCLLGSNGSGKTSLIRSVLSLTPPREGKIIYDNAEITGLQTHEVIRRGIGCIPEGRKVFPKLSVAENLLLGAYRESSKHIVAERLTRVYEIFPRLLERQHQHAGLLSGGEQAMVSIGRGMMGAPQLLLIDEPSLGLSPLFVHECFCVIEKLRAQGMTIFLVEQNVQQSLAIADYGYLLSKGRVVARGTPDELLCNSELQLAYFGDGLAHH